MTIVGMDNAAEVALSEESAFSPGDLNPYAWYAASELSGFNDGDAVSTWADESGNSRDLTAANDSGTYRASVSALNSKPAIEFDGSNDDYTVSSVDSSPPLHLFWVISSTATGQQATQRNDQNGHQHRLDDSGANDTVFHGSFLDLGESRSNTETLFTWNHRTDDSIVRVNGTQVASANMHDSGRDGSTFWLGSRNDDWFQGYIAEYIWYDKTLTSSEQDDVESHLADKYGFTL